MKIDDLAKGTVHFAIPHRSIAGYNVSQHAKELILSPLATEPRMAHRDLCMTMYARRMRLTDRTRTTGSSAEIRRGLSRPSRIVAIPCALPKYDRFHQRHSARSRVAHQWLAGALLLLILTMVATRSAIAELPDLRVGTLAFGSVDWEVDVIRRNKLDQKHGFLLIPVKLADKDAASVALLSGSVDVIVTDWLWVSHQRHLGGDVCFISHSLAVGGLMVPAQSSLRKIGSLVGRKIGVGGGPSDKSWLLLQAYAKKTAGIDLARDADIEFGAPPLLNQLALDGKLDAVVNFWQFDARLKAAGFRELLPIADILPALGIDRPPPLLGWVFHERWAQTHADLIHGFLAASVEAKQRLATSDLEWEALRPMMGPGDDVLFTQLRDTYRRGIPNGWSVADVEAARRAFAVMVETAGPGVAGGDSQLADGTFWPGFGP